MSKIGRGEWVIVYVIAGAIDVAQFLIGFFGVALSAFAIGAFLVAANEVSDPFIGAFAIGYFEFRGVSMLRRWPRALSLLCVAGIDELTGGIASLWILDIIYIHSSVRSEEAEMAAAKEQEEFMNASTANRIKFQKDEDGNVYRLPETETVENSQKLTKSGYGRARG